MDKNLDTGIQEAFLTSGVEDWSPQRLVGDKLLILSYD